MIEIIQLKKLKKKKFIVFFGFFQMKEPEHIVECTCPICEGTSEEDDKERNKLAQWP